MKKIYIVGAGKHGQNIKSLLNTKNEIIFIDEKKIKNNINLNDKNFLNQNLKKNTYEIYMGIGLPNQLRTKIYKLYKKKNVRFKTFIHKKCFKSKNSKIGEGSIIFPNVTIGNNVEIGKNCVVYSNSVIEHDTKISDHCYISPSVTICGSVKIGRETFIGAKSCLVDNTVVKKKSIIKALSLVK